MDASKLCRFGTLVTSTLVTAQNSGQHDTSLVLKRKQKDRLAAASPKSDQAVWRKFVPRQRSINVRYCPITDKMLRCRECPICDNSRHSRSDLRKHKDRLAAVSPKTDQCFNQVAAIAATFFRFLRRASSPITPCLSQNRPLGPKHEVCEHQHCT